MKIIFLLSVIFFLGCSSQPSTKPGSINSNVPSEADQLLVEGSRELSQHNASKAIDNYFDKVIDLCKYQYESKERKFYASRSPKEALFYMLTAAADKKDAVATSPTCANALYLKGYASIDLGQLDDAEEYIKRAIDMAPVNSLYLSELGHIYQSKRNWQLAFDTFTKAEKSAEEFSPAPVKSKEWSRAKRGVGFNLTELGKLDGAEAKYRECLTIDSHDEMAMQELKYIESLRKAK